MVGNKPKIILCLKKNWSSTKLILVLGIIVAKNWLANAKLIVSKTNKQ